ncbi:MAG: hypothetical protein ACAH80_14490 [Alphaproteobacteria bacterium]
MLHSPKEVKNISHPMVEKAYIKREVMPNGQEGDDNVLVLKLRDFNTYASRTSRRDAYIDFLISLSEIKKEVQKKAGSFTRIDIQSHH